MWLVAPLVSKLHSSVQGRILRVAGNVLDSTNFFTAAKKIKEETNEDSNESNDGIEKIEKLSAPQMSHQAFLGLILTCLKGQDEQKEGLLSSLHSQLSQFLQSNNEVISDLCCTIGDGYKSVDLILCFSLMPLVASNILKDENKC